MEKNLKKITLVHRKNNIMLIKQLLFSLLIIFAIPCKSNSKPILNNDSIRAVDSYSSGRNFFSNSNYQAAIDSFLISSLLRKKLYTEKSFEYGIVQNALGITYKNLGDFNKSIEHFLLAESAYKSEIKNNSLAIARLYNNIGNVYKDKLSFETALDYLERAVNILINKNDNEQDIADFYYNIAEIHFKLRNYQNALKITEKYYSQAYSDTKLFFLSLKAAIYQELNQYDKTFASYQEAIKYAEKFYSDSDFNIIFEYLNFTDFLIKSNRFDQAKKYLEKTNEILKKNKITEGLGLSFYYKTIGLLNVNLIVETKDINNFRTQKAINLEEAISYYKKALEALGMKVSKLSEQSSSSLEYTVSLTQSLELLKLIADTHTQIAGIYSDTKHPKRTESIYKALDYYKITSNLIQQARKEIYSDENKIQLSELENATFQKIIQAAYTAYEMDGKQEVAGFAFENGERMKASAVFDRLSDQLAKENSLIPDSLTNLERTLNYSITNLTEKLYNLRRSESPDNNEITSTDSILFQLKRQRDELTQHLENNYSDYYELKYAGQTISYNEVQQNLKNNEVLIEYVLNETDSVPELYAFLFSSGSKDFHKINVDSTFIQSIETSFQFMSNPAYLFTRNDNSKAYCAAAHHLYQKLIQPFESEIQNKKITIIPDGKLSYLPFDALLTEMPDTSGMIQFHRLPYLIKNNSINYAYSANLLFKFNQQKKKAKNRLLAFAPLYNADTIMFENEKLILVPLPGVQNEVDLIAGEINTKIFRHDLATEKNFREHSQNYDILHLAMHAFINDSMPAFSRLAFAQNHTDIAGDDGWLNTADIYNLDLQARLTVLSACNTGSGNLRKGEGVMSLARGFLYAGCPTIVMTLWEVEDNAGTKIMSSFYQNLKKGRSTDEALRLSKLNYLENANPRMAHPHYWLGYVSIGNSTPLFRSYDYYFFGLLVLALAGITIDQFIRYKRARKKIK